MPPSKRLYAAARAMPRLLSVRRLWDGTPHCAFTDLTRHRGAWLCVFREGRSHALCPGAIRILRSTDGQLWESAWRLQVRGVDLRDPKFAPAPNGAIDLVMGATRLVKGKPTGRHSLVCRSVDGLAWGEPVQIGEEGDWLWRVERHAGASWSITYRLPERRRWTTHLLTSGDGLAWREVSELGVPGLPNEALVRFVGEKAIALVRREADEGHAWIGTAKPPYRRWRWNETDQRVGGPNFLTLDDGRLIAATRLWEDGAPYIAVCWMTEKRLVPALRLPSGGDCGYPGLWLHRGRLWVSYYSSHEGRARVYLAQVALA